MLRKIRENTGSLVVKVILGLLIISFAAWGVGDMVTYRSQDLPVAEISGEEITRTELEDEVRREIARLNPQFGNRLTEDTARMLGLPQSVLGRMITDVLLAGEATDLRLAVSDAVVRDEVRANPAFQSALGGGTFDRQRLQMVLRQFGLSEAEYLERVRADVARSMVIDTVEIGLVPPAPLARAVFDYREEKRFARTLFVSDADVGVPGEPTDAEMRTFHKENAETFTAPELRALTLVVLRADDLVDPDLVTDDDVAKAFEAQADTLGAPERRRLSQMFLADRATADKAKQALAGGRDFVEVAQELAGMDKEGTDLGTVSKSEVIAELADAAFAASAGQVTEPIPGPAGVGFFLVKVHEILAAEDASLDTAAADLRDRLARERAVDSLYTLVNQLEDELGKGVTLEDAARTLNLTAQQIPAIDRIGNGGDGQPLVDLGIPSGPVATSAFETEEGDDSTILEGGDEAYFVLRVNKVTAPALRPFETVQQAVRDAVIAERRRDVTLSLARNLADRLKGGEDAQALATEFGARLAETKELKRYHSRAQSGIPGQLLTDIFTLTPDDTAVTRADDGYYVSKVTRIVAADATAEHDGLVAAERELAAIMKNDLVTQLAAGLRESQGVTVNEDVLRTVLDPSALPMPTSQSTGY